MKTWKTVTLFMALLLAPSILIRPVFAGYASGSPVFFSAEPIAVTCSNINTTASTRGTHNGLETPASPSPIGQHFNVSIWLRNATLTNVPAGITNIAVELNFTNILNFAQPIAYTDELCTPTGVYNTIPFSKLLVLFDGLFDNSGSQIYGPTYTGATQVMIAAAQKGTPVPWNGTAGLIATVEFNITNQPGLGFGNATGTLNWITSGTGATTVPITSYVSFDAVGATVMIDAAQAVVHDVAVTNVASSKTVVGQGYGTGISVPVANHGSFTESFNVTLYANHLADANTTEISTPTNTTLAVGGTATLTFTWDTTGFAYGNYTITASADTVPGEVNTGNNNFTDGKVLVTIPSDLNGDFNVTNADLVILAKAYGSKPGDANWNPDADINSNGRVSLVDLVIMAKRYLQHYP
jgi:hypothetical protein